MGPGHVLRLLLGVFASAPALVAACSDYRPAFVNCTFHCLNPDISASFYPELSHKYLNNSQVQAAMENAASTASTATPTNAAIRLLRVLCFGDSLTAGYSGSGYFHYPYATQVRVGLKNSLPWVDSTVNVAALSGDRVIAGQYLRRLKRQCEDATDKPYDWIIVLGGTNDLGWGENPESVYEGLKALWRVALDTGANVLALNVLEAESTYGTIVERRTGLNNLIASHVEDRLYHLDLCAAVPYFSMNDTMRDLIWDDGLHLTMDGYEMMGNAISKRLIELIRTVDNPTNLGKQN